MAFSPDGQRIVTGNFQTAKVWLLPPGTRRSSSRGTVPQVMAFSRTDGGLSLALSEGEGMGRGPWANCSRSAQRLDFVSGIFPDGQQIVTAVLMRPSRLARGQCNVAAWRVEERAAAQSSAALQRERTIEQQSLTNLSRR
jgi:hypothetical protein